jgi:hypothetical protein
VLYDTVALYDSGRPIAAKVFLGCMPMPVGRTAGTERNRRPGPRLEVRRAVAAFVAALPGFAACYVRIARRNWDGVCRGQSHSGSRRCTGRVWESGWRAWTRLARDHYVAWIPTTTPSTSP